MDLVRTARSIPKFLVMACLTGAVLATTAAALPLRSPQVPLQTGWDGFSLQSYLDSQGQTINTLTEQLDLQTWGVDATGSPQLQLMVEIAGYASQNSIGLYNAAETSPSLFQVFPGAASAGWYALCTFTTGAHLVVSLYDASNTFQGSTNYSGVDAQNFGFYLQGPAGTFYSQDYRNAGGKPQVLTFAGTDQYAGYWWECFEDLPYASSDVDFQDSILRVRSIGPTPTRGSTWGALKSLYR